MTRVRNLATFLAAAILVLSVSAFAFGSTDSKQPELVLASTDSQSETTPAETHGHGQGGGDAAHGQSDGHHGGHADLGKILPLWSCIPFAGMLLSIALCPLLMPDFWHHHFGKISAFWAATLGIPFLILFKGDALYEVLHIILADYVPFIILLWSLYTVSGGILLRGKLRGTPVVNLTILIIGTALASWMGTTGAAMLLIRPFLRANNYRKNRTFMVVFFIFLVANVGGSLTPLGDPPLFLGFLHGVTFFWTFNIMPHMLLVVVILLAIYFILDTYHYRKEGVSAPDEDEVKQPLKLEGIHNFLFLAGVVGAVLMSGVVDWGEVNTFGVHRAVQDWVRDGLLIVMGILSLVTTKVSLREDNDFTWFPIVEVAYLFIGIFITMIPCLLILKSGSGGGPGISGQRGNPAVSLFLGDRHAVQLLGQCADLSHIFQHRPGKLLCRHDRGRGGALADDGKRHLPQGDLGRSGFFRCLQLHRQCAEFHGSIDIRRGRYTDAQLFRLYTEIFTSLFSSHLRGGTSDILLKIHSV